MSRAVCAVLGGLLLASCAGAPSSLPVPAVAARLKPRPPQAAVVLLLNLRQDASLVYGTAVALDDQGHVATGLHLVSGAFSLAALTYDLRQGASEGKDLARYVYENRESLVPARLVRGDALTDLAILRIDAPTRALTSPPPDLGSVVELGERGSVVELGERLSALGHFNEKPWSVLTLQVHRAGGGEIEAYGVAAPGVEGSPFVNARGEVVAVGVHPQGTARVLGRPISVVRALFAEVLRPTKMDLSTPELGFSSCSRALQLGSSDYLGCMDWESRRRVVHEAFLLDAQLSGHSPEKIQQMLPGLVKMQPRMLELQRQLVLTQLRGGEAELALRLRETPRGSAPFFKRIPDMDPSELRYRLDLSEHAQGQRLPRRAAGVLPIKDWARMGMTVEALHQVNPEQAWLLVSSRDAEGAPFRFSQLLQRRTGKWLQTEFPSSEELAQLPEGWPKPLNDLKSILSELFQHESRSARR